jgi:hypothetical protein
MGVDVFGYDNSVQQINSLKTSDFELQQGVQDWNNTIQQQYNKDKDSENISDSENYAKDLISNIMGASGLNGAISNRKSRLMGEAKQKLAQILPEKYQTGYKPPVADDGATNPAFRVSAPAGAPADDDYGTSLGDMFGSNDDAPTTGVSRAQFLNQSLQDADPRGPILRTAPASGNSVSQYRNGGTSEMEDDLLAKFKGAGGDIDKLQDQTQTLLGKGLSKISGGRLGQGDAELLGKVGSAVTNGSIGGMDLLDGIENLSKGQSFFGQGSSGIDDVDKTLQMVAGASDVVGLIPGLEWVTALGNVAGLTGSVIGAFGDHKQNLQRDQNVTNELTQIKTTPSVPDEGGEIAGVSQSTMRNN